MIDLLKKTLSIFNQDERKLKRTFSNSLTPLGAQNKDIDAATQTFMTEVRLGHPYQKPYWGLKAKTAGGFSSLTGSNFVFASRTCNQGV